MSDEWYVLVDRKIRGPATTSQLRKSLEAGKIHPDTPVRAGTDGEWALIREIPELVPAADAPPGDKDSVLLASGAAPQSGPSRKFAGWLIAGGVLVLASLGGVIFAVVHWNRAKAPEKPSVAVVEPPAAPPRSDTSPIKQATAPKVSLPAAKAPEPVKVAAVQPSTPPVPNGPLANNPVKSDPVPKLAEPAAPAVRPAAVAEPVAASAGGASLAQVATARDSFDVPWPSPQGDAVSGELDWKKLNTTIREHNKLHKDWQRERQRYREICTRLNKIGSHLQDLERRAGSVATTMSKIRGVIGDDNANNADVFAPPETPRYVQSLAKTYTLRAGDMSRLGTKATRAANEFNAALGRLDDNLQAQKRTLTRAVELRGEWVRITRPFGLWTKQDRHIPTETSTRWILDNAVFAPAYVDRCVTEIGDKSFEKARQDIEMALARDPNWPELHALQAVLQDLAGKRADADKSFKTAHKLLKKGQPAFIDVCEGIVCVKRRNYEGAKSKFRSAAKHDPANPAGQGELALLLVTYPDSKEQESASAVNAATEACKATSWSHWWCLDVLAAAYAASGDFDRAIGCVNRAKQAGPPEVQQLLDEHLSGYKKKQVPALTVGNL
jgi:tetratricopeptide (TPR) repeat protein